MSKRLKIGIVGAGSIVRDRHLPGLAEIPGVEVVAVSNSTFESAQRFCEQFAPHATPMKNWVDLVALPEIDVVWIGTPPSLHNAVTVSALEAGKHVFCQARMAMDYRGAVEMLEASRRFPHLVTMLCPPPHGMHGDLAVRRLLSGDEMGDLTQLRLRSLSGAWLDPLAPAHWRQRRELSGMNILTLGIYVEVLQRWFGEMESVSATGGITTPIRGDYMVDIPDFVTVQCQFVSGLSGIMEFSGVSRVAEESLVVDGTSASLRYLFGAETLELAAGQDDLRLVEISRDDAVPWRVEADFISAVRSQGHVQPHPDFLDGVRYMAVVEAVHNSMLNGGVAVEVPKVC